jgi:hypothetical protein
MQNVERNSDILKLEKLIDAQFGVECEKFKDLKRLSKSDKIAFRVLINLIYTFFNITFYELHKIYNKDLTVVMKDRKYISMLDSNSDRDLIIINKMNAIKKQYSKIINKK